ncbi:unnamed protein product [Urochloa humidicola]
MTVLPPKSAKRAPRLGAPFSRGPRVTEAPWWAPVRSALIPFRFFPSRSPPLHLLRSIPLLASSLISPRLSPRALLDVLAKLPPSTPPRKKERLFVVSWNGGSFSRSLPRCPAPSGVPRRAGGIRAPSWRAAILVSHRTPLNSTTEESQGR